MNIMPKTFIKTLIVVLVLVSIVSSYLWFTRRPIETYYFKKTFYSGAKP